MPTTGTLGTGPFCSALLSPGFGLEISGLLLRFLGFFLDIMISPHPGKCLADTGKGCGGMWSPSCPQLPQRSGCTSQPNPMGTSPSTTTTVSPF